MYWPRRSIGASRLGKPPLALILLTLAYVGSGRLGLMLAVPPGYGSAIFPPAGIAVAAMLIAGRATLPWTFLGSFLLNLWTGYLVSRRLDSSDVAVAVVIAAASTAQAALAGGALRRWLGVPTPLDNGRDLARFFALSPLCCLTSATLSLAGMWVLGAIDPRDLIPSWMTWWIGDTLGVLVVLPLMLVLAGEPRALWRGRALSVAAPMLLFAALFVAIFARATTWESDQTLLEFRLHSQQLVDGIKSRLEEQEVVLEQLERSFSEQIPNSADAFAALVQNALRRFPTIQAVEWAPRINAAERPYFERVQRSLAPDFAITERDGSGAVRPAAIRTQYFPVTFIVPLSGNEPAMGLDLASDAARNAAVIRALESGTVSATAPLRLVQEHGDEAGLLLILGVRDAGDAKGVIVIVLRMGTFMEALLRPVDEMMSAELVDLDQGALLYGNISADVPNVVYERAFDFGGRRYLLRTRPSPSYLTQHRGLESWGVLAAGVFSTGLLGALLMLGTGQAHRTERLVEERTRDLRASAERLRIAFEERQQAETALRQAQKMEAVGQLTGGLAHDFNNLLTVISGNLDLLRGRHAADAQSTRLIGAAQRGAERGARLIQSLLAFSRKQMLKPEIADINLLITEFSGLLQRAAGGLVDLELRLCSSPLHCHVDAAQFQTALLNLVTNARDAMARAEGRIAIRTGSVTLGRDRETGLPLGLPEGEYVRVSIADSGSGMTEDVAARVFEPFYTTKDIGKGSGLGLAQVYGFVKQSGGDVHITSSVGVGTTVALYLPRAPTGGAIEPVLEAASALAVASPLAGAPRATILVVDDDHDVRDTIAASVGALGYRVLTATDAASALEILADGTPVDLLLTDYAMPRGLLGDELARRAMSLRRNLKVILISGHASVADSAAGDDLPLLRKPYRQDDLLRAIREALDPAGRDPPL